MTKPADLLPSCTAKVEVAGKLRGTAFFIGPATLLTCSHVIQLDRLVRARSEIAIIDRQGRRYEVDVERDEADDEIDLAILKVRGVGDQLCVLVDSEVNPRDELFTYGYTEKYGGEPTTLDAEGPMENNWIKLRDGQVKPGMSGAPILNVETGGVCGILKRSRDPSQPTGGYAVPITVALGIDPGLKGANDRAHEQRRDWFNLLDRARQQRLTQIWSGRVDADQPITYLIVTLGPDDGESEWRVRAEVHPGDEVIETVRVDLNVVRLEVARLFRDWASRGRVGSVTTQVQLLGSILYGALFPVPLAGRFESLSTRDGPGRLVVALHFDERTEPDLMHLPWEHLYRPARGIGGTGTQLAIEPSLSLIRTLEPSPGEYPEPERSSLSVLVVPIQVKGNDAISRAVENLERVAEENVDITVEVADSSELEDITRDFDVVHYCGFGRLTGGRDEIAVEDDAREIEYVPIDVFAQWLRPTNARLVVLELAGADKASVPADFAVLAPGLLDQVPAVVANQFPLEPKLTATFNATLYKKLALGAAVDEAVQEARNKLRLGGRAFASPALWMRQAGTLRLLTPSRSSVSMPQGSLVASRG